MHPSSHTALLACGLAVSLVASPWIASAPAADAPTTQSSGNDLLEKERFKDPKSGISLRPPNGWGEGKTRESTKLEAPAKDRVDAGGLAPNIVLGKDAAPGIKPTDIDAVIAGKRKQYVKVFPEYKDESPGDVLPEIAGKGIGRIDGTFKVEGILPVHFTQFWIIENDLIYTVTCMTLLDTHSMNGPRFDAVAKTIEVP